MIKLGKVSVISLIIVALLIIGFKSYSPVDANTNIEKLNMTYLYFGDKSLYTPLVDKTKGSVQVVSPSYFDLYEDGSLKKTNTLDINFINDMHLRNIKVTPFLSNHWSRDKGRKALENKEQLVTQVVDAIKTYNLDGLNVDLENLTEFDRENYVEFVKLLRENLPSDKTLSVAVAANPYSLNVGWQGSYDYKKLSEYSDYLFIMTYDESWEGSSQKPIASLSFVEKSINYALNRGVDSDKILLGIPFYGRIWKNDGITPANKNNWNGDGTSFKRVDEIMNRYNGQAIYDEVSHSIKGTFTVNPGEESIAFSGKELYPGEYTIWYDNEKSIKEKLDLVQKYNLKGTASWALGQELESTWDYYSLWLNGKYFEDIENHWALKSILSVQRNGWMVGTASTVFSPNMALTRAQAATTLVRALNLEKTSYEAKFNDVKSTHWAKDYIDIANENGLFIGDGNGRFLPDKPLTREEMAVVLDRVIEKKENSIVVDNIFTNATEQDTKTFLDINEGRWSYNSIVKLGSKGIIEGYPDGTYRPNSDVTRAQMATLINKISIVDNSIFIVRAD